MVTIFCEEITPRVDYTFDLVFNGILGVEFKLTSDQEAFSSSNSAKFSYGSQSIDQGPFFRAAGLLAEDHIVKQSLDIYEYKGYPALFKVDKPSVLEYDLFSAIFYLVSRYEEYLPHEKDEHGRYMANQSIACQNGFIELPIVEIWAGMICRLLQAEYSDLERERRSFQYINTIDIDNAFAYTGKGVVRTVGGIVKSALRLDGDDISGRLGVLSGKDKDPYDTYAYMRDLAAEHETEVKSFVLLGNYGKYDKNLPHSNEEQIGAIKRMAKFSEVGMHPSYDTDDRIENVRVEMNRLADILGRPVKTSRQHYLKLKLPETYKVLLACGIEEDHSMGYSEVIGFRAGTCTPFHFYDLEANERTELMIVPFALMDRTLNDYMQLSPREAIERISKLVEEVRHVNGALVSVWHNESLSDEREWKGWLPVYEHLQLS